MREIEILTELLSADRPAEALFHPGFLAAVPPAEIARILVELRAGIGPVETIAGSGTRFTVETATHTMPVEIVLGADGRITGLFFRPAIDKYRTLPQIAAQLDALPGTVSYLVTRDGAVLAARAPDAPLAVGSAFKIGVLALLAEAVARGERDWADVVRLEARHLSLPSGILNTFPPGAPLTLHSAAALMISISDNTATDLLIELVGREALAERLGIDFALTTREFFALKSDPGTRAAFLAAAPGEREAILAPLAEGRIPADGALLAHQLGVEWYVPASRLCALIAEVAHLEVMAINPGPADAADWAGLAYKGGSETGVLNMTTHLTDAAGSRFAAVLTINADEAIDPVEPTTLYASLIGALKRLSAAG